MQQTFNLTMADALRFLADSDLKYSIVIAVRRAEPAIDFQSAQQAGIQRLSDPVILHRASEAGRVLITHDFETMLNHFRNHLAARKSSPGLLVAAQSAPVGAVVDAIVLLWTLSDAEQMRNRAIHIPSLTDHWFVR